MTAAPEHGYHTTFQGGQDYELIRLAGLADAFDPATRRVLTGIDLPQRPRVLEIGVGIGSIAEFIAATRQPSELVLLDRDDTLLHRFADRGMTLIAADVDDPAVEPGQFDLVHARMVLMYLPSPGSTVARLTSWLRPGGWLVVGDAVDSTALCTDPLVARTMGALFQVAAVKLAADGQWARQFPAPLHDAGLADIDLAAGIPTLAGGGPLATNLQLTLAALREAILAAGLLTAGDIDAMLDHLSDPAVLTPSPLALITTWGRRRT